MSAPGKQKQDISSSGARRTHWLERAGQSRVRTKAYRTYPGISAQNTAGAAMRARTQFGANLNN
jgi:hypothetical protein